MKMKMNMKIVCFILAVYFVFQVTVDCSLVKPQGPLFVREPPSHVDFSNASGTELQCVASGYPPPTVHWIYSNGSKVTNISTLSYIIDDNTLKFLPFNADEYRQDVHASVYRCLASNVLGTIVSKEIRVRAVVKQYYEIQVYDEFVIKGSVAVMKCQIPSFVQDYVIVSRWIRESNPKTEIISQSSGRFTLFSNGVLHILDVGKSDYNSSYKCQTQNLLTKETKASNSAGRVIISEPTSGLAPRVVHSRSHVESSLGNNVELPCTAQGFPQPIYSWSKLRSGLPNAISFTERIRQQSGTLIIDDVTLADSATYVCLVKNSVGTERVDTVLTVTAPLTVSIVPNKQVVDEGKSASFSCTISGHPIAFISWIKDGEHLVMTERVKLISRDVLHFDVVKRQDQGMYQCLVRNDHTSAQAAAELRIGDAVPILSTTFSSQAVHPESRVSLQCSASGNPIPQITWTLDESPLPINDRFRVSDFVSLRGDVISYVNISRVIVQDGGTYKCSVENRNGRLQHAATLNVFGPPFIRPMQNVSTVGGEDLSVHCRFGGHPIESIRWEHNGTVLPTNHRQKVFVNGTLLVKDIQGIVDKGFYTCKATNKEGSAERSVFVDILNAPIINPFSFLRNLREGVRTGVQCLVIEGDRPVTISWFKDGKPISSSLGIIIRKLDEFTSSLVISSISSKHNGNYTCVVRNPVAVVMQSAILEVNVPPKWIIEPEDSSVILHKSTHLDCQVNGTPTPNIVWKKAVGKLPEDYKVVWQLNLNASIAKNGSLFLPSVQEIHEGYYVCQASNGVGSKLSKVVYVKVHMPARIKKFINQVVIKGAMMTIMCEVKGDGPIDVQWKHKQTFIDPTEDRRVKIHQALTSEGVVSEMIVSEVKREDGGQYSCHANNEFGKDEKRLEVFVKESPESPKHLKLGEVGSRNVKMSWTPSFDGNDAITHFIVQFKTNAEVWSALSQNVTVAKYETQVEIKHLRPAMTYQFRIVAENSVGFSEPSSILTVTTKEEAPGGPPLDVHVESKTPQSLTITWKPPTLEKWNGKLGGYHISYKEINSGSASIQWKDVGNHRNLLQYTLTNLKKFTQYEISVRAFNQMGNGPNSPPILIFTKEDVPSKPPVDVQCSTLSSKSIFIKWTSPESSAIHGRLQGYKIVYFPVHTPTEQKTLTTTYLNADLLQLEQYSNYSVQVAAFTREGHGVFSLPNFCKTDEGVPGPPAEVKGLVMSSDSIMVSWKEPQFPNGNLLTYNVYFRNSNDASKPPTTYSVASTQTHYDVRGLKEDDQYEFWVTAATAVGEGQRSRRVFLAPISTVPAKIATFAEKFHLERRNDATLPCRSVGIPTPDKEWRVRKQKVQENSRIFVVSDGSLMLTNLRHTDSNNYTCRVANIYSTDEITHQVIVNDAPNEKSSPFPPEVRVLSQTTNSISIQWTISDDGGAVIERFFLYYKQNDHQWTELPLEAMMDSYTLMDLQCGSQYNLYMTAENRVGSSKSSEVVVTSTMGMVPDIPSREHILEVNSSHVTLDLSAWPDGGCTISYFVIEYKQRDDVEWLTISDDLTQQKTHLIIDGLSSGVAYLLRITAFSNAGTTTADYDFVTLLEVYAANNPESALNLLGKGSLFANVVIPLVSTIAITILLGGLLFLVFHCRKHQRIKQTKAIDRSKPIRMEDCSKQIVANSPVFSPRSSSYSTHTFNMGGHVGVTPYATTHLTVESPDDRANIQLKTFIPFDHKTENAGVQKSIYQPAGYNVISEPLYANVKMQSVDVDLKSGPLRADLDDTSPPLLSTQLDTMPTFSFTYLEPSAPLQDFDTNQTYSLEQITNAHNDRQYNTLPSGILLRHTIPDLLHDRPDSNSSSDSESPTSHRTAGNTLPH